MDTKLWAFVAVICAFTATPICAHDVVWPGNPIGFTPQEPLRLQFGATATVEVKPVTGEPCFVEVNLDPVTSTLIKVEMTVSPALQVDIRVTPLRAATNASEIAVVSGEWHATGFPDPRECTAIEPHRFSVTVQVLGGPSLRHRGRSSVGFIDGHAEPMQSTQWYYRFTPWLNPAFGGGATTSGRPRGI